MDYIYRPTETGEGSRIGVLEKDRKTRLMSTLVEVKPRPLHSDVIQQMMLNAHLADVKGRSGAFDLSQPRFDLLLVPCPSYVLCLGTLINLLI